MTATFDTVPPIGGPPVLNLGQLFCGVRHRGHCNGLTIKTDFESPGNAVWTFGAYNVNPGNSTARDAKVVNVLLGTLKLHVTKAGVIKLNIKLKPGANTRRLYQKVVKLHLALLRIQLSFTSVSGIHLTNVKLIRLKH